MNSYKALCLSAFFHMNNHLSVLIELYLYSAAKSIVFFYDRIYDCFHTEHDKSKIISAKCIGLLQFDS